MRRLLLSGSFLFAALATSRGARASDPDPWFGRDKALHFGLSVGLAATGYGVSSIWLKPPAERAAVGGAFSLSLGAGKELWDLAGHGDPSWRDFTWDVIGTAVGLGLSLATDALIHSGSTDKTTTARSGLVVSF
ncbi:MAG TPA: hypothetical protein VGI10_30830 [Polyangiaceae bacterium]|jgi:putative lipoprotein